MQTFIPVLGRSSSVSRRRKLNEKQENSISTNNRENYRSEEKPPRQRSAATESSTSEGRRRNKDGPRATKIPQTIKTQASSSTLSSMRINSREHTANRITINGQTYEKVK